MLLAGQAEYIYTYFRMERPIEYFSYFSIPCDALYSLLLLQQMCVHEHNHRKLLANNYMLYVCAEKKLTSLTPYIFHVQCVPDDDHRMI